MSAEDRRAVIVGVLAVVYVIACVYNYFFRGNRT